MAPQQFQPQSNTASRPTQSSGTSIQTVTSATQTLQSQPTQNPRQMNQMPPSGTTFSFGSPATVTPTRNPHQTPSWTSHHSYTSHGTSTAASSFLSRLRQAAYGQSQATPTANFANPPSQSAQSLTTASGRPAPGQTITVVRPQVQPTTRPVISNGSASAAAAATTQTFRNLPVFNYPSASSMNGPSASSTTSSAQALLQLREYFLQTYGVGSISARHPHSYSNSAPVSFPRRFSNDRFSSISCDCRDSCVHPVTLTKKTMMMMMAMKSILWKRAMMNSHLARRRIITAATVTRTTLGPVTTSKPGRAPKNQRHTHNSAIRLSAV